MRGSGALYILIVEVYDASLDVGSNVEVRLVFERRIMYGVFTHLQRRCIYVLYQTISSQRC
jgi:hypothetical protein